MPKSFWQRIVLKKRTLRRKKRAAKLGDLEARADLLLLAKSEEEKVRLLSAWDYDFQNPNIGLFGEPQV